MKFIKYLCIALLTLSLFACGQSKPKIELTDAEKIVYDLITKHLDDADGDISLSESAVLNLEFMALTSDGEGPVTADNYSLLYLHDDSYCWILSDYFSEEANLGALTETCSSAEGLLKDKDTYTIPATSEEDTALTLTRIDHEKLIAYYKQEHPEASSSSDKPSNKPEKVTLNDIEMYTYEKITSANNISDDWKKATRIIISVSSKVLPADDEFIYLTDGDFCLGVHAGVAIDASDINGQNGCKLVEDFMGSAFEKELDGYYYYTIDPQKLIAYHNQK